MHADSEAADQSRRYLLDRVRVAAVGEGAHEAELDAVEVLLEEIGEADEPLGRHRALPLRREHLRFSTGRGFLNPEPMQRAVDLSAHAPDSWQHGYARAELAHASLWADAPDADELASRALECATASVDTRALAYAYAAASMGAEFATRSGTRRGRNRGRASRHDGARLVGLRPRDAVGSERAGACGPPCSGPRSSAVVAVSSRPSAGRTRTSPGCRPTRPAPCSGRETGAAAPNASGSRSAPTPEWLPTSAPGCPRPGCPPSRADIRRPSSTSRAPTSLFADTTGFLAFEFEAAAVAGVRLAAGDAEGAWAAALAGTNSPGLPPTLCEWLCPLAARALADLAEAARQAGHDPADPLQRLPDLVSQLPRVIGESPSPRRGYVEQLEALDALYDAEVARVGAPTTRRRPGSAPPHCSRASAHGTPPTPRSAPARRCSSQAAPVTRRPPT